VREGFAEKFPEVGLHKCRISTHEQIEKCRAKFGDEVVEALHDELRHQTKVYDETVEPLELAKDDALDRWNSALQALVQTPPETIEGLAAVLAFVSTDQEAVENVRHRTTRSKGCLSNKTALAMTFKLAQSAETSWHRLRGYNHLPKIIMGVKFNDGIEVVRSQAQTAAA
jgi:hypothetical protein